MATSTSPTAGDGTLAPNQLSVNDYYQAGVPVPSGPSGNGNSNLGPIRICEFDALKAIQGKGCGGVAGEVIEYCNPLFILLSYFLSPKGCSQNKQWG